MEKGLSKEKVIEISKIKNEPEWMTDLELNLMKNFKN